MPDLWNLSSIRDGFLQGSKSMLNLNFSALLFCTSCLTHLWKTCASEAWSMWLRNVDFKIGSYLPVISEVLHSLSLASSLSCEDLRRNFSLGRGCKVLGLIATLGQYSASGFAVMSMLLFLGRQRRPYIDFRNRVLYGFMFVTIYLIIYIYICHKIAALRVPWFTKLKIAFFSLAQPDD